MFIFCGANGMTTQNWFQDSTSRVRRHDGCEVSLTRRLGKKSYWTAMVPVMQEGHAWCSLANENGIMRFSSALEAIKAVESYLAFYEKKFPKTRIPTETDSLT